MIWPWACFWQSHVRLFMLKLSRNEIKRKPIIPIGTAKSPPVRRKHDSRTRREPHTNTCTWTNLISTPDVSLIRFYFVLIYEKTKKHVCFSMNPPENSEMSILIPLPWRKSCWTGLVHGSITGSCRLARPPAMNSSNNAKQLEILKIIGQDQRKTIESYWLLLKMRQYAVKYI